MRIDCRAGTRYVAGLLFFTPILLSICRFNRYASADYAAPLQVAVETLLGLKNAQSSKGSETLDEASAQAMAAVTAAAVSAAAAAAQEAAANATAAGADDGSAASAAAAAAATAKAVAQAVAAARGIASEEERSPTMGSRFDMPSVGDGNEATAEASAALATAVQGGHKFSLKMDGGTAETGVTTGAAATVNRNGNAGELAQRGPHAFAPVHGGPEESTPESSVGREESNASRSATSAAVVPPAGSKRNAAELSCSDDVTSAEATSKRGRTMAPPV